VAKLRYSLAMIRTDPPRPKAGETVPVLHLRAELPLDRIRELVLQHLELPPKKKRWFQRDGDRYDEVEVKRAIRIATALAISSAMSELMNKRERQSGGTTTGRDG
jgi:hypothetical protein